MSEAPRDGTWIRVWGPWVGKEGKRARWRDWKENGNQMTVEPQFVTEDGGFYELWYWAPDEQSK